MGSSNLENGVAMRMVDNKDSDDEYRQIGRQRHHPANQIRPQWVRLITILHRVIFDETEHEDCLQTSSPYTFTSTSKPSSLVTCE